MFDDPPSEYEVDDVWGFVIGSGSSPSRSKWESQSVDKRFKNSHKRQHYGNAVARKSHMLNSRRKTHGRGARSYYRADTRVGRFG